MCHVRVRVSAAAHKMHEITRKATRYILCIHVWNSLDVHTLARGRAGWCFERGTRPRWEARSTSCREVPPPRRRRAMPGARTASSGTSGWVLAGVVHTPETSGKRRYAASTDVLGTGYGASNRKHGDLDSVRTIRMQRRRLAARVGRSLARTRYVPVKSVGGGGAETSSRCLADDVPTGWAARHPRRELDAERTVSCAEYAVRVGRAWGRRGAESSSEGSAHRRGRR